MEAGNLMEKLLQWSRQKIEVAWWMVKKKERGGQGGVCLGGGVIRACRWNGCGEPAVTPSSKPSHPLMGKRQTCRGWEE